MTYDKQDLARLGKRASDLHINHGMSLNDAVVKVAHDTGNLTEHHITRVLENANLITFEEKFKGSDDKHIVFDLADPIYVSRELDSKSSSPEPIDDAYLSRPSYHMQSDPTIFDHEGEEKSSSYSDINMTSALNRDLITAKHAVAHMESDLNRLDSSIEYEMGKLAHTVSSLASLSNSASAPLELMSYASSDHNVFEKVAHTVVASIPSHVPRGEFTGQAPNKSHPIFEQYQKVESLIKEASTVRQGLIDLNKVSQGLHKQLRGLK